MTEWAVYRDSHWHGCLEDRASAECATEIWWVDNWPRVFWEYRGVFWAAAPLYMLACWCLQRCMKHRAACGDTGARPRCAPFFKHALFAWNVLLSLLSWGCLSVIAQGFWRMGDSSGVLCYQSVLIQNMPRENFFWFGVFCISKLPEMLDTIFLLLNKRRVITLHWWHHVTVLLFCWAQIVSYPDAGDGPIFALANSAIHSIMYPYFALAVKFKCVRWKPLRITITFLQISQMFLGLLLRYYSDTHCANSYVYPERARWVGIFGWLIYGSYMVLFLKFFYEQYVAKAAKQRHLPTCPKTK